MVFGKLGSGLPGCASSRLSKSPFQLCGEEDRLSNLASRLWILEKKRILERKKRSGKDIGDIEGLQGMSICFQVERNA